MSFSERTQYLPNRLPFGEGREPSRSEQQIAAATFKVFVDQILANTVETQRTTTEAVPGWSAPKEVSKLSLRIPPQNGQPPMIMNLTREVSTVDPEDTMREVAFSKVTAETDQLTAAICHYRLDGLNTESEPLAVIRVDVANDLEAHLGEPSERASRDPLAEEQLRQMFRTNMQPVGLGDIETIEDLVINATVLPAAS